MATDKEYLNFILEQLSELDFNPLTNNLNVMKILVIEIGFETE